MNKVEEMLLEVEDSSVLFKEFMNITKSEEYRKKHIVPCIFEGDEDFSFYDNRVKSILGIKTEKMVSNGIDKSYEFLDIINGSNYYSQHLFILFLDSDFYLNSSHVLMSNNKVFRLDKYSIENFYITDNFFINVLDGLTNLQKIRKESDGEIQDNSDYFVLKNYIVSERDKFLTLIEDYMLCLRAIVINDLNIKFRDPDDVLGKLIKNSRENLIHDGVVNSLLFNKLFPVVIEPYSKERIESSVYKNKYYFNSYGVLASYRGKDLLYISYKVLNSLKNRYCQGNSELIEDFKFSKQLNFNDFISDFSVYTEEPKDLRLFLEEFKINYLV